MIRKLSVLVLLLCPATLWGATSTYTFDYPGRITAGTLSGQDNWLVHFGDSSDVIQSGTGFDTSNVMANPVSAGPTGVHRMSRTNDANFNFGSLAAATGLTLSFDTQVMNIASDSLEFINFSLADVNDANGAPTLAYKQESGGTPQWAIAGSPGGGSNSGFFPSALPTGDWIRMSFVMDFTANAGLGSGSLFFNDLTTSGPSTFLGSLSNLGNPIAVEALWNTMWSRSDNGPGAADSHVVLDNLTITPTFAPVPEITGAWPAGACAIVLFGHFVWRRRRLAA